MKLTHITNAQTCLREAQVHLLAMGEVAVADRVQGVLNHCGAIQRAIERGRDLDRAAERNRKTAKGRTWSAV